MEYLPNEILERIIRMKSISYKDLICFIKTCKIFKEVGDTNDSWMRKFKQTWPDLFELLSSTPNTDSKIMWKNEFERRLDVGKVVRDEVSNMSPKCFFKAEPSLADFQVFEDLVSHKEPGNSYTNLYVLNELIDMVHVVIEGKNFSDLTTKYYAEKCLEYVRHQILKEKLNILLKEGQSNDTSHEWDFRFLHSN